MHRQNPKLTVPSDKLQTIFMQPHVQAEAHPFPTSMVLKRDKLIICKLSQTKNRDPKAPVRSTF